jgi:biotin carboxyl carrier protein
MKFRLKIAEDITDIDVSDRPGEKNNTEFTIGEKVYAVRYRALPGRGLRLIVNGKGVDAFVAEGKQGKYVFLRGKSFLIEDADKLPSHRARRGGPDTTPGDVTPPMPSVVVRILIEEGDLVEKGQGLIVVTAMKMETTLVAPSKGRVKKINTSLDAKVSPGDILVEIEEEERKDE